MEKTIEKYVGELDNNEYNLIKLVVAEGLRYSKCEDLPSIDYKIAFDRIEHKDILEFVKDRMDEVNETEEEYFLDNSITDIASNEVPILNWFLIEGLHYMDLEELEQQETIEEFASRKYYELLYSLLYSIASSLLGGEWF